MIKRIVLMVLDSVGVGELPDAALYGDEGSNTLKNIYKHATNFSLPNLERLGILNIKGFEDLKGSDTFWVPWPSAVKSQRVRIQQPVTGKSQD